METIHNSVQWEEIIAIIGSLFLIPAAIAVIVINLRKYSNMERMKLIETGGDPSLLTSKPESSRFNTLRFSLLLVGIGTGFLLGSLLDKAFDLEEVAYFAMLFICGGSGLLAAYLIQGKKDKE